MNEANEKQKRIVAIRRAALTPPPLAPRPGQAEELARRRREAEGAALATLRHKYANLKNEEAELERTVSCVTTDTDYKNRARQLAELDALRDVLDAFPPEVREYNRHSVEGSAAPRQSEQERLNQDRIRQLNREISVFGAEIAGYNYRLNKRASVQELQMFAHTDSPESAYKRSLSARRDTALAEIERRRQEIAELERQIETLQAGS